MNIQKQNFLEQQLILKEIELEAYQNLNEVSMDKNNELYDPLSEGVVAVEVCLMKKAIDALKKENFPKGICNFCGTTLKDGNFVFAEKSPFSYCNKGCQELHEDTMAKKAEKNG